MSKVIGIVLPLVLAAALGVVIYLAAQDHCTLAAPTADPAAAPAAAKLDEARAKTAAKLSADAAAFLVSKRDKDGGWGEGMFRPAMTAMAMRALVQSGQYKADSPLVQDAVKVIMKYRQADGGFYEKGLQNYNTSIVVSALAALKDPQYKDAIDGGVRYIKGLQIKVGSKTPDGKAIGEGDARRGGIGYGDKSRPDLSNQSMAMEALHDAGVGPADEAMKEALLFLQHTQNRKESNDLPWAQEGSGDGGFIYAPFVPDKPGVGETKVQPENAEEQKGLRSYGSMTYAGFKSYIYAGLEKNDPRVTAALDWIRRNWRLDSNPNMPHAQSQQGLYYYYMVFARAMRLWGEPVITDTRGAKHNWRNELVDALAARVAKDGSWSNPADRWHEGDPALVTSYVLLALSDVTGD